MWVFSSEIIESKISILVSPNIIAADIVQEIMFPDFFWLWVLKSAVRVAYSKPACSASHQVHNFRDKTKHHMFPPLLPMDVIESLLAFFQKQQGYLSYNLVSLKTSRLNNAAFPNLMTHFLAPSLISLSKYFWFHVFPSLKLVPIDSNIYAAERG